MYEVLFTLHTRVLPAEWKSFVKSLGCRQSTRRTQEFPIWWRIDGSGYTLWLSEWRLFDSSSTPPTWQIKLEALAPLPLAGKEQWEVSCVAIEKFLKEAEDRNIGDGNTYERERV